MLLWQTKSDFNPLYGGVYFYIIELYNNWLLIWHFLSPESAPVWVFAKVMDSPEDAQETTPPEALDLFFNIA